VAKVRDFSVEHQHKAQEHELLKQQEAKAHKIAAVHKNTTTSSLAKEAPKKNASALAHSAPAVNKTASSAQMKKSSSAPPAANKSALTSKKESPAKKNNTLAAH